MENAKYEVMSFAYGSVARYMCLEGYSTEETDVTVTCGDEKKWSPGNINCTGTLQSVPIHFIMDISQCFYLFSLKVE